MMKKTLLKLAFVLSIGMMIFTSCKKDKNSNPAFEFIKDAGFTYENTSLAPGDSVKVGFNCTWNGSDLLTSISTLYNDNMSGTYSFTPSEETAQLETWLTKTSLDEDKWVFELNDAAGNKSSLSITISKDLTKADVEDIPAIKLGAQENATDKGLYSLSEKKAYSKAEGDVEANQSLIDLVCAFDDKNAVFMGSPGTEWKGLIDFTSWTTINTTYFVETELKEEDFNILTKTKIKSIYDPVETADLLNRKAKSLAVGKVFVFKTQSGKYGAFRVTAVTDGAAGSATFDAKIEK